MEQYGSEIEYSIAGNDLAAFIRTDIPALIETVVADSDRYKVQGSAGQGNWARCPWVAVFDRLVTTTARKGYYVVYLLREDQSGVYLSLNQGVTDVQGQYGASAKDALMVRSADYLAQLGIQAHGLDTGPINLSTFDNAGLGAFYEVGNIAAKFYDCRDLPTDEVLKADLSRFMSLYSVLVDNEISHQNSQTEEDDEAGLVEDLRALKMHKRIERNRNLAKKAKQIHGHTCQVCSFDFERHYGPIGVDYIEAHHLTPLAELKGQRVTMDPRRDFAVLCANCHRMIHKSEFVGDIAAFKECYYRR